MATPHHFEGLVDVVSNRDEPQQQCYLWETPQRHLSDMNKRLIIQIV